MAAVIAEMDSITTIKQVQEYRNSQQQSFSAENMFLPFSRVDLGLTGSNADWLKELSVEASTSAQLPPTADCVKAFRPDGNEEQNEKCEFT